MLAFVSRPDSLFVLFFPTKLCGVLVFRSAPPPRSAIRVRLCVLTYIHTQPSHTQPFHTQLCHTPSLSRTSFHKHNPVTHSTFTLTYIHTQPSHTQPFHTQLCHTPSLSHTSFHKHNPVTHTALSHTHNFVTHNLLTHNLLTHTHNFVTGVALGDIYRRFAWQA